MKFKSYIFLIFFLFSSSYSFTLFEDIHTVQTLPEFGQVIARDALIFTQHYPYIGVPVALIVFKYYFLDILFNYVLQHGGQKSTFLLNVLYYMGARADAQLLRNACGDYNSSLAFKCLSYGADPNKAKYIHGPGADVLYEARHY